MNMGRTAYYPVFLKLNGKKCTVIGGGQVALRKVQALLECGAGVEVISLQMCAELSQLTAENGILVCNREYRSGDVKDSALVIAATDNKEVNRKIALEARREGVLVNSVDDPESSDFIVPSSLRRGDITIAVSTSGDSPAMAKKIRLKLEKELEKEYASLAEIVAEVRGVLKERQIKVSSEDWLEALDLKLFIEMLKKGQHQKVKNLLLHKLGGNHD